MIKLSLVCVLLVCVFVGLVSGEDGIFIDSGIVWQDKSEFILRNFFTGFGGGLHLHLPYINILRLEYAVNDKGENQFIIDAGVAF